MKFLLLFAGNEDEWRGLAPEELSDAVNRISAWYGQQVGSGRIVQGGRLAEKASARTVRLGWAGRSGAPIVTDGPFIEAAESIGSYAIVEADDVNKAMEVAASWPGGGSVEVRPLVE